MALKTITKPRKQASQARSQATVDALLRATARILVKDGYDRASTNKIAALAGVSVGSLYQYFPSKESLVAALMRRHIEDMAQLYRDALPRLVSLSLEDAARQVVHLTIAAHALDPKLHRVLVEQVPRIGELERIQDSNEEMITMTRAFLELKRDELVVTDLELASFIVVGIIESLTHAAVLLRPQLLGEAFEREVADAVTRYLRGGPTRAEAGQKVHEPRSRATASAR